MTTPWKPKNWEEACKRNAGRRKMHMRKREARADRIVRLLAAFHEVPELHETSYGWLDLASKTMKTSRATASRDLAFCRRVQAQFIRLFGRTFNPETDRISWSWNWSHYGFQAPESIQAGYRKPVGHFPFNTRETLVEDEAYGGFNSASWEARSSESSDDISRNLISLLRAHRRLRL